jgi:hypothetical protein
LLRRFAFQRYLCNAAHIEFGPVGCPHAGRSCGEVPGERSLKVFFSLRSNNRILTKFLLASKR